MKHKLVYAIVALAFVSGIFATAYAGPALTNITLGGNVDVLGDAHVAAGKSLFVDTIEPESESFVNVPGDFNVEGFTNFENNIQLVNSLVFCTDSPSIGTAFDCLSGAMIIPETVTSNEIRDGTITSADLAPGVATWNSRVPQSTSLFTVDSTGDVGTHTSITTGTDGLQIVSYRDETNTALKVAHCTNASCSLRSITTIDSTGNVGFFNSITIGTDGLPVISYLDNTNGDLKVVHCTNTSCSTFDTPTAVDSTGSVGSNTSITIGTDGFPIVSYRDVTNTDLKVVHCKNITCSGGVGVGFDTPTTLDTAGSVGFDTSITIGTDGLPVISYQDNTKSDLKVVHCKNITCSGGVGVGFDTPTTVDSTGFVGRYTSITIGTDGLPIVSYIDVSNTDLKVVHCTNTSCSTFDTPTAVDSVGEFTSITIGTDGLPVISYRDATNDNLKVAHCGNTSCSTFDTSITVDSTGNVGRYTSITIGTDGLPVVSYYDTTNQDLKVAKCTNPYCLNNWIRR